MDGAAAFAAALISIGGTFFAHAAGRRLAATVVALPPHPRRMG